MKRRGLILGGIVLSVVLAIIAVALNRGGLVSPSTVGRDPWTHDLTVHSDALGHDMRALIFEPPALSGCAVKRVLVLFHGRGGDEQQWMDGTFGDGVGIDTIAHRLIDAGAIPPMAIVSADIDSSYGVNSSDAQDGYDHGQYFTYIADELMMAVHDRVSQDPRDDLREYVGGLSMGGYAALNLALTLPEGMDGVIGFSPAFFVEPPSDRAWIYEGDGRESLIAMADAGDARGLSVFLGYGRNDYDWIRRATDRLSQSLVSRGIDAEPVVVDGGHDVGTWRALAEPMLRTMFSAEGDPGC